jgi:hypothetical protein
MVNKKYGQKMTGSPAYAVKRSEREEKRQKVLAMADEIFEQFACGKAFWTIARDLPFEIKPSAMRDILINSDETKERYATALVHRAHHLIETSIEHGQHAAMIGDAAGYRVAIDVNLKVAAKIAPREYGDTSKLELTGKNGGALQIKADLTLTAEQAYERLIKGE